MGVGMGSGRIVVVGVATTAVLGACQAGRMGWPSPEDFDTPPGPACASDQRSTSTVHLGPAQPASLRIGVGSMLAVTAGPGLTAPAVAPSGRTAVTPAETVLSRICLAHSHGGAISVFRADSHGDAYVSTSRPGCPGCISPSGAVLVTVISVPGQEEPFAKA
jgi:hypothetical protein